MLARHRVAAEYKTRVSGESGGIHTTHVCDEVAIEGVEDRLEAQIEVVERLLDGRITGVERRPGDQISAVDKHVGRIEGILDSLEALVMSLQDRIVSAEEDDAASADNAQ